MGAQLRDRIPFYQMSTLCPSSLAGRVEVRSVVLSKQEGLWGNERDS